MPFRKFFSGPKPEEPPPYAGSLYPAQNHGATAPLSPMFRPSSSSPPLGPPWQTPLAQRQASNGFPNQSYFAPPPGNTWQAPTALGQDYSRAPSNSTIPPAQHQMNMTTYAPQPSFNQAITDSTTWTAATQAENQVRNLLAFSTLCTYRTLGSNQTGSDYRTYDASTATPPNAIFTSPRGCSIYNAFSAYSVPTT